MFIPLTTAADFGAALTRARKGLGITQRELALAIGVGERFIVDLEAGKPTAQLGKSLQVLAALGCSFDLTPPPETGYFWAISRTRRWKGSLRTSSSVLFW